MKSFVLKGLLVSTIVFFLSGFVWLQAVPANNEAARGVEEMVETDLTPGSGAPPGPFGKHWVHVQEVAYVDSYDSRIGPYVETKGADANVGSNCDPNDSEAGVSADNNSVINGDISVTTSEEEGDISLTAGAQVTGSLNYNATPIELLDIDMPSWYTAGGGGPNGEIHGDYGTIPGTYEIISNGLIAHQNAIVTFDPGEYHFDNFELAQNVVFNVGEGEGVVKIYVGNSVVFENNNELNPPIKFSGDTTKLRIYFNGTTKVDLSNNVEFYGLIYAPNARIEVKNNDKVYGNLVGEEVYIWNGGGVHYDKALEDVELGNIFGPPPIPPTTREDWKEIIVGE